MLFNSGLFLFGFFPAFLVGYFATPSRWRNATLLAFSLLFFAWVEPIFVFWAFGSALLDYALGSAIAATPSPGRRRLLVGLGVGANLVLLGWFKYAGFAAGIFSQLLEWLGAGPFTFEAVALPVAISFIVFEKITYLVDLQRGSGKPAPNLATYLLYVFYFPKLLAGPIIRYCDIQEQLIRRRVTGEDFRAGLVRFVGGLGKKVLIADHVGHYADQVFALAPWQMGWAEGWLGVAAFTLQIYFDFSGYSDIAIGISRMLGFRLNENFNQPYLATSFTEFWKRWHISLTTWIRNYLYFPLGGNRRSPARTYLNLSLCFLLSGLWHGAAWTFLIWGAFHGLMLAFERATGLRWQKHLPAMVNRLVTLALVMVGWVAFRARDAGAMTDMLRVLFSPGRTAAPNEVWFSPDIAFAMLAGAVLVYLPLLRRAVHEPAVPVAAWRNSAALAGSIVLLLAVIGRLAVLSYNAFIYFRF
jgi:alginate O-acetyltransferase complex protein AlgI